MKMIDGLLKAISPIVFLLLSIVAIWVIALYLISFIEPKIDKYLHPGIVEEVDNDNK